MREVVLLILGVCFGLFLLTIAVGAFSEEICDIIKAWRKS